MSVCNNCPRKCNINREDRVGICGVGSNLKVARAGLHFGEEPCISGENGSGTIFFSGCSLKCVMCQNFDISHNGFGKEISPQKLIEIMKNLEAEGANNINFVTPSHYFNALKEVLNEYRPKIPIVYNSSGYDLLENIQKDLFDVYLFDLKYFSNEKALKYSKCADYFNVASNAIKEAVKLKGLPKYNDRGVLQSGVIVRHLILPSSTNDAISIIDWLSENTPEVIFSLMSQYVPMYKASEYKELNRKITAREYNKVLEHCFSKSFSDVYIQDRMSATKEMIPIFDLTGVKSQLILVAIFS